MQMPFGKYRGREIHDLPDDYLRWIVDQGDEFRSRTVWEAAAAEWQRRGQTSRTHAAGPDQEVRNMALELIRAGLHRLAAKHHSDHGGSDHLMKRVNLAAAWLRTLVR